MSLCLRLSDSCRGSGWSFFSYIYRRKNMRNGRKNKIKKKKRISLSLYWRWKREYIYIYIRENLWKRFPHSFQWNGQNGHIRTYIRIVVESKGLKGYRFFQALSLSLPLAPFPFFVLRKVFEDIVMVRLGLFRSYLFANEAFIDIEGESRWQRANRKRWEGFPHHK